jgi:hypothetical protein
MLLFVWIITSHNYFQCIVLVHFEKWLIWFYLALLYSFFIQCSFPIVQECTSCSLQMFIVHLTQNGGLSHSSFMFISHCSWNISLDLKQKIQIQVHEISCSGVLFGIENHIRHSVLFHFIISNHLCLEHNVIHVHLPSSLHVAWNVWHSMFIGHFALGMPLCIYSAIIPCIGCLYNTNMYVRSLRVVLIDLIITIHAILVLRMSEIWSCFYWKTFLLFTYLW